jgi:hypothetical protein
MQALIPAKVLKNAPKGRDLLPPRKYSDATLLSIIVKQVPAVASMVPSMTTSFFIRVFTGTAPAGTAVAIAIAAKANLNIVFIETSNVKYSFLTSI